MKTINEYNTDTDIVFDAPTVELEPYLVRRMTREEAVARIKDHIEIHRYYERNAVKIFEALVMAIGALEQPEIIRCKDCKHLQKCRSEESAKKFGQIYECARNVLDCPKPEDFCSRAERRIDESD